MVILAPSPKVFFPHMHGSYCKTGFLCHPERNEGSQL